MEIISVVKSGDKIGEISFKHDGKKMTLSAKDVEYLYRVSDAACSFFVFNKDIAEKYPDPSELPEIIPIAERNRTIYNEYNTGVSKEELAEKYGLKVTTVKNIVSDIKHRDLWYNKMVNDRRTELKCWIEKLPTVKLNKTNIYKNLIRDGIDSCFRLSSKSYKEICKVRNMGKKYADILLEAGYIQP